MRREQILSLHGDWHLFLYFPNLWVWKGGLSPIFSWWGVPWTDFYTIGLFNRARRIYASHCASLREISSSLNLSVLFKWANKFLAHRHTLSAMLTTSANRVLLLGCKLIENWSLFRLREKENTTEVSIRIQQIRNIFYWDIYFIEEIMSWRFECKKAPKAMEQRESFHRD